MARTLEVRSTKPRPGLHSHTLWSLLCTLGLSHLNTHVGRPWNIPTLLRDPPQLLLPSSMHHLKPLFMAKWGPCRQSLACVLWASVTLTSSNAMR